MSGGKMQATAGVFGYGSEMLRNRDRIRAIVRTKSFSYGKQIRLSSGKSSLMYFDMKPTMMDPEASYLISLQVLSSMQRGAQFIGGLEMGAVPIVSALAPVAFVQDRVVQPFFVRKRAKEHGARKQIEGISPEALKGQKVVLVDDVTTSGNSAMVALETIEAAGGKVAQIISIVDREEGARELFESRGVEFTPLLCASEFLREEVH